MDVLRINSLPLNTTDIPQSILNIENKERCNLFPWRGQFSPQLIEALLTKYAHPDYCVLDPFAGSGTVVYEAALKRIEAIGSDINPSAYRMAATYNFINENNEQRFRAVSAVDNAIRRCLPKLTNTATSIDSSFVHSLCEPLEHPLERVLLEALIIRLDLFQQHLIRERISDIWDKLRQLVLTLPLSPQRVRILNCDARTIPLPPNSIDLVITSPPYINVFNYHQQYRTSAEALGSNLLEVAKSEIGANRKHRSNRFLTVTQYCLDIAESLRRLTFICKPESKMIFVVGRESRVRGVPFNNAELVNRLGVEAVGLGFRMRQERMFKNKFGQTIYEDILHFDNSRAAVNDVQPIARLIAGDLLDRARRSASSDTLTDIEDALARVSEIEPSPLYLPGVSRQQTTQTTCAVAT
jgi:16S rRNA G966 N2-methylase RsmD